jgi:hypothetical protein
MQENGDDPDRGPKPGEENPDLAPRPLEVEAYVSIVEDLQPVIGQGRAQDVAAQLLTAVFGIAPTQRMTAQSLKSLGYTTGALYAYLYFNRADLRGFERGIDYFDDTCAALHVNVNGPAESVGTSARQMADKGVDFIRAHGQERFFLSWMHFYDPHLSYERHAEAPNFGNSQNDLYDGEIWFTDLHFGRVLDELRAQGLWDKKGRPDSATSTTFRSRACTRWTAGGRDSTSATASTSPSRRPCRPGSTRCTSACSKAASAIRCHPRRPPTVTTGCDSR